MEFRYTFNYAKDLTQSTLFKILYKKPKVLDDEETIDYILNSGRTSVARFGDGEVAMIRGYDLGFQKYDKRLAKKLKNIQPKENCLVCIPCIFDKSIFNEKTIIPTEYKFWIRWNVKRGGLWNYYFRKYKLLGDAFISRFYLRKENKDKTEEYVNNLKRLWQDRNIVFVEGEKSRLGIGNDLFDNAKSIRRILCPAVDAFDKYEEIKYAIEKDCEKDDLIIMAIGPTATVLAYELSDKFQCLDLGHVDIEYEWFRMGATKKEAVKGKFVNEVEKAKNPEDCKDQTYLSQIIEKLI